MEQWYAGVSDGQTLIINMLKEINTVQSNYQIHEIIDLLENLNIPSLLEKYKDLEK